MKTKFYIILPVMLLGIILFQTFKGTNQLYSHSAGAPAARCGDPAGGNKTCSISGCHTGPTPISINGLISSNIPAAGYTPGATYTFTASISRAGHSKFGFEASPQNTIGTSLGTLIATSAQTQLVGTTSNYITHTSSGTSGNGSKTWSFNWTAPAAGSGNVTIYSAFNATNSNNNALGDSIFTSTLLVTENTALGVNHINNDEIKLSVFPNPASEILNLSFATEPHQNIEIILCDIQGKNSAKLYSGISDNKNFSSSFDINEYPAGVYLLKLKTGSVETTKKIIIE